MLIVVSAVLLWSGGLRIALAQEKASADFNFAYASFFGTGWYKIDKDREAFVIRAAPRWEMTEASLDEKGNRQVGYSFRVPVTIGLARLNFDDIPGIIDAENFSSTSIGLAFDADIPINERWSLRPGAELGYASVIDDSPYAWTYRVEVRARYRIEANRLNWALIGGLGVVGNVPNDASSEYFSFASIAAEFEHPTRWSTRAGKPLFFYSHLSYTDHLDEVEFGAGSQALQSLGSFWQLGGSLGRDNDPIRIWRFNFDRLGLGYNYSTSSEFRGIKLFFRSLYEL